MKVDGCSVEEKLISVERYNYRNAVQALVRMSREEGVGRLYSGWVPNTGRVRLWSLLLQSAIAQTSGKWRIAKSPSGMPIDYNVLRGCPLAER